MKKFIFGILTIGITIFVMYSCEKEARLQPNNTNNDIELRGVTKSNGTQVSLDDFEDPIELTINQFALALSQALKNEKDMRNFIYIESGVENNKGEDKVEKGEDKVFNEELILSCIKNKKVNSDSTFENVIDRYLKMQGTELTMQGVINLQPNLMIKRPDKFISAPWDPNDPIQTPSVLVSGSYGDIYYNDGMIILGVDIEEGFELNHVLLRTTEKNLLVNKNDYSIYGQDLSLPDIYNSPLDSCQEWLDFIDTVQSCSELADYSFVNLFKINEIISDCLNPPPVDPPNPCDGAGVTGLTICNDISTKGTSSVYYGLDCDGDGISNEDECNNGTDPTNAEPTELIPFCDWECNREVEWDHQRNDSKWVAIKLASRATFDAIDNCKGSDVFLFRFDWLSAINGTGSHHYDRRVVLNRYDLLHHDKYVEVKKRIWVWGCFCYLYVYQYQLVERGDVKWAEFPQKIRFFKNYEEGNNWTLDNQGDYFHMGLSKYNTAKCTSGGGSTESQTIVSSLGINAGIYAKGIGVNGSASWRKTNIVSSNTNYTVTGYQIVELDKSPVDFCEQKSPVQEFEVGGTHKLRVENEVHEK